MICLLYKHPETGEEKLVQNGGTVPNGFTRVSSEVCPDEFLLAALENRASRGFGNVMAVIAEPIAKALGRPGKCTRCEARRLAANAWGTLSSQYGKVKALEIIKDVWKLSGKDATGALKELQKWLIK